MRIYVSHASSFDYKTELYQPLQNLQTEHTFIFPHDNSGEPFNTKALFDSKGVDLVLAEVSYPSTGQGIELGWADYLDIPIVSICKKGSKISGSLSRVSPKIIEYDQIDLNLLITCTTL